MSKSAVALGVLGFVRLAGRILWLLAALGGCLGAYLVWAAIQAEAAPAQGAAAALAAAVAVIPYVLARAWNEFFAPVDLRTRIVDEHVALVEASDPMKTPVPPAR